MGGASAYANSRIGGAMAARAAEAWKSDARWGYIWSTREKMAEVSLKIGRETGLYPHRRLRGGAIGRSTQEEGASGM